MKIKSYIVGALFSCAIGYAAYELLLNEEARESLTTTVNTLKEAYSTIKNNIEDHYGLVINAETNLPNVEKTKNEWQSIGY